MAQRRKRLPSCLSKRLPRRAIRRRRGRNFAAKKNLRLVEVKHSAQKFAMKQVSGGMLVQDADIRPLTEADLKVATARQPTRKKCGRCCLPGRSASM